MTAKKKPEDLKPRGGPRVGAGRPKVDRDARSSAMLDELLIPAFKAVLLTGELMVSVRDLQDAYGVAGLADWRTWFEEVRLGHGISRGGVPTTWRLKLKLAVAASKLLSMRVTEHLLWPTEQLRIVKNKRAYEAFWIEHKKHAKEVSAECGTQVRDPEPYDPAKNYVRLAASKVRDDHARAPITAATKGYSELLVGVNYGFTAPYSGWLPSDVELPY